MDKFCNKCQSIKPFTEFYKNKALKDGLTLYCKTCCKNEISKKYQPKKKKEVIDYSLMTEKKCVKCDVIKSLSEFNKNKSSKDGLTIYCKNCCNLISEKYRKPKKESKIIDYSTMVEKHCNKCNTTKPLTEFYKNKTKKDGYQCKCKICCEIEHKHWRDNNKDKRREWSKSWVNNNSERYKELRDNWIKDNPEKYREYRKKYYELNPEKKEERISKLKEWRINNPEKVKESRKKWEKNNPEKIKKHLKKSQKNYYQKNKEKINEWLKTYMKERRETDVLFKISMNYRTRLYTFYKNSNIKKIEKTDKIIGCSWEELHRHIESKFKEGMSNDNYGDWHIDHIIPLASAKNEQELIKLCHYTNLQPLWAEENRSKNDKIL